MRSWPISQRIASSTCRAERGPAAIAMSERMKCGQAWGNDLRVLQMAIMEKIGTGFVMDSGFLSGHLPAHLHLNKRLKYGESICWSLPKARSSGRILSGRSSTDRWPAASFRFKIKGTTQGGSE